MRDELRWRLRRISASVDELPDPRQKADGAVVKSVGEGERERGMDGRICRVSCLEGNDRGYICRLLWRGLVGDEAGYVRRVGWHPVEVCKVMDDAVAVLLGKK